MLAGDSRIDGAGEQDGSGRPQALERPDVFDGGTGVHADGPTVCPGTDPRVGVTRALVGAVAGGGCWPQPSRTSVASAHTEEGRPNFTSPVSPTVGDGMHGQIVGRLGIQL